MVTREMDFEVLKSLNAELKGQVEALKFNLVETETSLTKKCRVLSAQLNALEADKIAKDLKIEELEDSCVRQKRTIEESSRFQQRMEDAEELNNKLHGK